MTRQTRSSAQSGDEAAFREVMDAHRHELQRALVERFTRAFQSDDIDALVALLTEDVWISMPPMPFEWQGHERAREV